MLALTASNPESNAAVEVELQINEGDLNEDELNEDDAIYYKIGRSKDDVHGTKILSNLWHPFRHFMAQLQNLKNPRLHSKIKRTLLDVLSILNSKRFLSGADNRL